MVPGHLCVCTTSELRTSGGQPLGTVHVLSEMLLTITKSLPVLVLQVQQLHIEEAHELQGLCMSHLCYRQTQEWALLLEWLVMVVEKQLADSLAW